jgi:hypothetical protein
VCVCVHVCNCALTFIAHPVKNKFAVFRPLWSDQTVSRAAAATVSRAPRTGTAPKTAGPWLGKWLAGTDWISHRGAYTSSLFMLLCIILLPDTDLCYIMAHAVSHHPVTFEARDWSQAIPCGICEGCSGTDMGFSLSTLFFPCQYYSSNAAYSIFD